MELSEQVKSCKDIVRVVVPLLRERAEKTGAALAEIFGLFVEAGQKVPESGVMLLLLARGIEIYQERLEAADFAHSRELGDDVEPRDKRDKAASSLYSELTELRGEIEAFYGSVATQSLGMSGTTPQDPPRLESMARDISDRLQDETFSLGDPKKSRMSYDRKSAGLDLLWLANNVKQCIKVVDKEVAEAKTTQEARARALEAWQDKVPKFCAAARGLLLASGDEEGASRIVSTPPRSPSQKTEEKK
jgi:hypothetical protein